MTTTLVLFVKWRISLWFVQQLLSLELTPTCPKGWQLGSMEQLCFIHLKIHFLKFFQQLWAWPLRQVFFSTFIVCLATLDHERYTVILTEKFCGKPVSKVAGGAGV